MEGFHNIITNVFEVVLQYFMIIPPYALSQLESKLLIKVDALVHYQVGIPVIIKSITLIPSPGVLYRLISEISEGPLVSCEILL